MTSARQRGAVLAGKLVRRASRSTGRGGTALPGLVAERIAPSTVQQLARDLTATVLVTGTNGKTTTSAMLAAALVRGGHEVIHNRAGSNLMRGVATALLEAAPALGGAPRDAVAVLETDEASLPEVASATEPTALVITNLMRDQLDRYGEIDAIRERWLATIERLPESCTLILNADDPLVASLASHATGAVLSYGIEDAAASIDESESEGEVADALWDPESGEDYEYEARFFAHLGHWRAGDRRRPTPGVQARAVVHEPRGVTFELVAPEGFVAVELPLQGLYNVSNATAAAAAAVALGEDLTEVAEALQTFEPVFGRQESFVVDGHTVRILLGKNPAGLGQALATLRDPAQPQHLLVLLNDGLADGTDVSWIWDTNWEALAPHAASLVVGGTRAADMALRLRYAGFPEPRVVGHYVGVALDAALEALPAEEQLVILPTYTALLDVRQRLGRMAGAPALWERA